MKLHPLLRSLFRKSQQERDLDAELRFHLDTQIDANLRARMTPGEARRRALLTLGGVDQVREGVRDVRPGVWLETLWQDVRFGARVLRKSPGFTFVAVSTLALGIGAVTAICSVVHAVVLRPLPYPEPERLVTVWEKDRNGKSNTGYPTFTDWQAQNQTLEHLAAISYWSPILSGAGTPEQLEGASVTPDYFRTLGVAPMLGRDFAAADDRSTQRVVILSHRVWKWSFGGNPSLVGKSVLMNGLDRMVVGIMPPGFQSLTFQNKSVDAWRPLHYQGEAPPACRTCRHLNVVARIRPGMTLERAGADLNAISARMVKNHPSEYAVTGALLEPLTEQFVGQNRRALYVLLGAVSFVLLVACANVANLLLIRAVGRQKEFALRAALGARRGRIVRQLLVENLLLAGTGGVLGILLARWGMDLLLVLSPPGIPRLEQTHLSPAVQAFALGLTLLTGVLFGLAPALSTGRWGLRSALEETGRSSSGKPQHRLRDLFVVVNVALALVLLAGAGLMLNSLTRLLDVNPGFARQKVLTMNLLVFGAQYYEDDGDARVAATYGQILERIRALPSVQAAGLVNQLPLGGDGDMYGVRAQDKPTANPEDVPSADRYAVTPGYLEAMGIPLRRGRTISEQDAAKSQFVALVNETFARRTWANEDPLGKFVQVGAPDAPWRMVVGVVGDVHHTGLDEPERLQFYVPESQWMFADAGMVLAVRTAGDPLAGVEPFRRAIWSVSRDVRIAKIASTEQIVDASAAPRRFVMLLLAFFAATAVLLAAMGVYGVAAYGVTQRTQEIGIRLALGARPGDVVRLVLRRGIQLLILGVFLGLAGGFLLTGFLRTLLFAVAPSDPQTFLSVTLILLAAGALACYLPARRATKVDPLIALRYE
jgi:putative ABC transport system permease protein